MKTTTTVLLFAIGLAGLQTSVSGQSPILFPLGQSSPLANLSCRTYVGTGSNVAIAGFVVATDLGSTAQILVRAIGPSLSQFALTGILAKPVLSVFDASGRQVATNTGWSTTVNASQLSAASSSVGAFPLPAGSADSALLLALPSGNYTAVVAGLKNTTGLALIEVYSVPSAAAPNSPAPPVGAPPSLTPGAGSG